MNSKIRSTNNLELLCAEVGPEDGIDPRKFFRRKSNRKFNRKVLQLCKQIQLTLNMTLAGEFEDKLLQNLEIIGVEPVPDSSHLLVILTPSNASEVFKIKEVMLSLQKVSGLLRSEAARSINRKRVPELSFRLLSPQEVKT
jgi:ribosome-binding factor A